MATPRADIQRAYRDRKRGGPPRPPQPLEPCGTNAAYKRHQRHGEPIDELCREKHNERQAAYARAARARKKQLDNK